MKEFLKKRWVWITAAAVLAAAVLATVLILTLGGGDPADGSGESLPPGSTQSNPADGVLGTSNRNQSKSELGRLVADLYYQAGVKEWGDKYAIALGGGYVSVRGSGYLAAGQVTYGDLQSLLPLDNELVLCSVKGADLLARFLNGNLSNYYISYNESIKDSIDSQATYYVVTDTYTADVAENKLTVVEQYTSGVYARDLLAAYIEDGGLGQGKPVQNTPAGDDQSGSASGGQSGSAQSGQTPSGGQSGGSSGGQSGGASDGQSGCKKHTDANGDTVCDTCRRSVIVYFDFYGINDLHGKLADTSGQPGVDELTTYLKNARSTDDNAVFLSAGDMWQGSAESNLTYGRIITDWMNELDFTAMALGNHEYDWGESYIEANDKAAEFPLLAINIYDRATNTRVSYCDASVMVDQDGIQIGIIGAIGDCYSSISSDKTEDVYFKVGSELTSLVKAESTRLRQAGADFIVYVLHDGHGKSNGSVQKVSSSTIRSYYDTALSDGYVDLVFEGHTHQGYLLQDEHGVYHLQNRGDNKGGISHAEVAINSVTLTSEVKTAELISTGSYQSLADDPVVENLLDKYEDTVSKADRVLGTNRSYRNSDAICNKVAELYCQLGEKTWGKDYDIVLGGGFLNTRSPYKIVAGPVKYGDLQMVLPFDNQIVLCSIQGKYLLSRFINTKNSDYYISYSAYGNSVKGEINPLSTYYVVVDSYTAQYTPNKLTVVKEYDAGVFARDLLADYIAGGGWS